MLSALYSERKKRKKETKKLARKSKSSSMITEPLLINKNPKGGLRTLPFIIANEAFERMATMGFTPNMILYLCREYRMETTPATNIIFFWTAATNFLPIIGAFLADSYVGRYRMIGFGCFACLLGMVLLWSTTILPGAKPPACNQLRNGCETATWSQLMPLYFAFGLMSLGSGGIRSSSLAFGAEQLDKGDGTKSKGALQSYFCWYYVFVSASSMVAVTCIVYIQDNLGWKVGFGVPAVIMLLSALSFFLASPFYVKSKANTSLLPGLTQVLVGSFKNRRTKLPTRATEEMFHHGKGSMRLMPSENLRFLNKACMVKHPEQDLTPDGRASNPSSLCTVEQVEELKALIKVIPLWSTGIMIAVTTTQSSFLVLQASFMDRHVTPNFEIPSGSFTVFSILTLTIWIGLYDRVLLPLASKIKGKPCQLSLKLRMGAGLLFSTASTAAWAIVEATRRSIAINEGISDDLRAVVQMSALWQLPYLMLSGLAMAFNFVGQTEFYYTELPKSMSSIASTLSGAGLSAASLVASFIMNAVDNITKRGGNGGWIPSNINKGHYDYYYWLLTALSMANFLYYLACCKAYGPFKGRVRTALDDKDGMEEEC